MAYSGKFKPLHPEKYRGDTSSICFRSLWEYKLMKWLDSNVNCIEWQSEEMIIPYRSPLDNRIHRYFPDFVARFKQKDGTIKTVMIEVKPESQTRPPPPENRNKTKSGRVSTRFLNQVKTYAVNEAKWKAAKAVCDAKGWEFMVMTEKHLGV